MVLAAPPEDVHAVLVDLEYFGSWWPQVRAVASLGPDDALVVCRSVLPYDLELHLHAESREPWLLRVAIDGPIRGYAQWTLSPVDVRTAPGGTRLDFEQRVRAEDRSFVLASYVLKPLLRWNHHRMMAGAEEGLARKFGRVS
ncbi:polyketide cyclase [Nocardioides marmorisolisilvae]|uniref:Polyketide cyclase n=2 Tax=Nocardioides marmorisolisilvae TaxID=1542737 RepID=A0A3N0DXJ4_9ACTN|nr:polyketide cyclase [Nocardioides marmorisolisilvae]